MILIKNHRNRVNVKNLGTRIYDLRKDTRIDLIIVFFLGIFTVLGFAPFYLFPLPVVTLALLFYFWRKSETPLRAGLLGFFFGMGMFSAGVTWLYVSLHDFGEMPASIAALVLFFLCAYLSLFASLTGWILAKLRIVRPVIWSLTVAALWTLSEWLRGVSLIGFPWLAVGYSQAPASPLAGFAGVTGVYGVSLVLILSAAIVSFFSEKKFRTWFNTGFLLTIWCIGFGLQHINWSEPIGEPVTVSLLQGNIQQDMKWRPEHAINTLAIYDKLMRASSGQLIVTPEIAVPLYRNQLSVDYFAQLVAYARKNNGDILIGMIEKPNQMDEYYNSVFSFGVSPQQSYRKHHLVPFGEFIPLKPFFSWVINVLKIPMSDFSRGRLNQNPMNLVGQNIALNICYEDVFGEEIISQLPQASLLINVSNDAWFGRSIGPWQHLQMSQMRALETGRYMLRATNTGVTAIINERGVVLKEAEVFTTTVLNGTVQGYTGATPYVRFGNSLVLGFSGILLLISFLLIPCGKAKTL